MPAGTKLVNGFSAYSSGTRHKQRSFMIISEGAERAEVNARRPINDPRPIAADDLWANIGRNLGRQPEKATALDFLDHASGLKRGAVQSLQSGLQPAELRERRGLEPTTAHVTHQRRQEAHGVSQIALRLKMLAHDLAPVLARLAAVGPKINDTVGCKVEQAMRPAPLGGILRKNEHPAQIKQYNSLKISMKR